MYKFRQTHQLHCINVTNNKFCCPLYDTFHLCPQQQSQNDLKKFKLDIIKLYEVPMTLSKKVYKRNHNYQYQRNTCSSNYRKRQSRKSNNQQLIHQTIEKNIKRQKDNVLAANSTALKRQSLTSLVLNQHQSTYQTDKQSKDHFINRKKVLSKQRNVSKEYDYSKKTQKNEDKLRNTLAFLKDIYINKKHQNKKLNKILPELKKRSSKNSQNQEKFDQVNDSIIRDQDIINIDNFLQNQRSKVKSHSNSPPSFQVINYNNKKLQKIKYEVYNRRERNQSPTQKLMFRMKKQKKIIVIPK